MSDTLREGAREVLLEVEEPPTHVEVDQEMDDDAAGESDVLLDLPERASHSEAEEETNDDTSGGGDNRSHDEPEPSSHAETNKKVDFVLVYETWQEDEAEDEETQTKARIRETFEANLAVAGLDVIESNHTEPSSVSLLSLSISLKTR